MCARLQLRKRLASVGGRGRCLPDVRARGCNGCDRHRFRMVDKGKVITVGSGGATAGGRGDAAHAIPSDRRAGCAGKPAGCRPRLHPVVGRMNCNRNNLCGRGSARYAVASVSRLIKRTLPSRYWLGVEHGTIDPTVALASRATKEDRSRVGNPAHRLFPANGALSGAASASAPRPG